MNSDDLAKILYSFRFTPNDAVGPLIEELIEYFKQHEHSFDEKEFRVAADYKYNTSGLVV